MDPNPNSFPILSYVMSKLPSFGARTSTSSYSSETDIEQPPLPSPTSSTSKEPYFELTEQMPHLTDPKLISEMRSAVADVSHTRSILKTLGDRPDHESVDTARTKLVEIEFKLSEQLDEISLSPPDTGAEKNEDSRKKVAERQKQMYKAVISLDEMHEAYGKLLKEAEERLQKIYDLAVAGRASNAAEEDVPAVEAEEVNEEVIRILQDASEKGVEWIDLSNQHLRFLPEAFGKIRTLVALNLSSNQLEVIPDSIAGLENLEVLNLSSNLLESLPESIGLLLNMKVLDVSSNKLTALPDSICHCRSLVELDASFNKLTYLPTNIGYELVNLRRLSIQLNKIRSLPTTIGEMSSLCFLDVHFNELRGLPLSIGRLTNLELLNLSSNFNDLTELPDTFGDLINLKELDLSNNQIHALPITFGRLDNLVKLNLEENPMIIPPKEVVDGGVEAVKAFMSKMWLNSLVEEEEHTPMGWLTRSTSWLKDSVSVVSESVSGYLGVKEKSDEDPYLNQEL